MATILLIIIYIAFIGLGLPDSLFGTAWPAMYMEWELPFSFGSVITIIMTCGTIFSSVMQIRGYDGSPDSSEQNDGNSRQP